MDEDLDLSKNTDLNQALNEFQAKAVQEPVVQAGVALPDSELPKMVRLVMKLSGGAIKKQRQAEYVLLGFVFITIVISLFLFFSVTKRPFPLPADKVIWVAGPQN